MTFGHLSDEVRLEGAGQADGLGKMALWRTIASGTAFLVQDGWDAQPGLLDEEALNLVDGLGQRVGGQGSASAGADDLADAVAEMPAQRARPLAPALFTRVRRDGGC